MSTIHIYAIIHDESGMLLATGATEAAAWAEAEAEAERGRFDLDRDAHDCRKAKAGHHWQAVDEAAIVTAREVETQG